MNDIKVYDDLFEQQFLMQCHLTALSLPWTLGNVANRTQYPYVSPLSKGSHVFFGCCLYKRNSRFNITNNTPDIFIEVLEHFVQNILNNTSMSLIQIDANLQVSGQDGSYHNDTYIGGGKDRTIIFYPHIEWKEEWGGELQILDGDLIHNIFPNPGKIVCFDSTVKHRALAPSLNDKPRMSIAFRMIES